MFRFSQRYKKFFSVQFRIKTIFEKRKMISESSNVFLIVDLKYPLLIHVKFAFLQAWKLINDIWAWWRNYGGLFATNEKEPVATNKKEPVTSQ